MIWFEKSTRFSLQIRTPSIPIMPYRTVAAPPRTPAGTVAIAAPNAGNMDRPIAKIAATQYAAVEYTLVAAITPMFSA